MKGSDHIAYFSSSGPTKDGRMKPDVIAPGHFILSARARGDMIGECDEGGDGHKQAAGTSMVSPVSH